MPRNSDTSDRIQELFNLSGRVAIVTGGAGLLGFHHGSILAAAGANVVLLDMERAKPWVRAEELQQKYGPECMGLAVDITSEECLIKACGEIVDRWGHI